MAIVLHSSSNLFWKRLYYSYESSKTTIICYERNDFYRECISSPQSRTPLPKITARNLLAWTWKLKLISLAWIQAQAYDVHQPSRQLRSRLSQTLGRHTQASWRPSGAAICAKFRVSSTYTTSSLRILIHWKHMAVANEDRLADVFSNTNTIAQNVDVWTLPLSDRSAAACIGVELWWI